MPEDTNLNVCSNCAVWGTEYRLAKRITSCAGLGFDASDTCRKWESKDSIGVQAVVRVREPSLAEILQDTSIRGPWKDFHTKLKATTAHYNQEEGYYYYFFDRETLPEAEKFASTLSSTKYVKRTQGVVLPLRIANLEEGDKERFRKLAKVAKAE